MTGLPLLRHGARRVRRNSPVEGPRGHLRGASPRSGPRDAVVLSGGGSLGAVQVGALLALRDAGIVPDLYVGCSVGALNAAFAACGEDPGRFDDLAALWRSLGSRDIFPGGRATVAGALVRNALHRRDHLYDSHALRSLVRRWVPVPDLGLTTVPCHVVTTDLLSGEPVWHSSGVTEDVLTASAALPGLFAPVSLGGSLHVDGGVVAPVPTARAVGLGATRVWVLDVTGGTVGRVDSRMTALDVLLRSFAVSRSQLGREVSAPPGTQVLRMPALDLGRHEMRDFSRTPELIEAGLEAGRRLVADAALRVVPGSRHR